MKNLLNQLLVTIKIAVIVLSILLAVSMVVGCSGTRNVIKSSESVDSTVQHLKDSFHRVINETIVRYETLITNLSNTDVDFEIPECPDIIIDTTCNKDSMIAIIRSFEKRLRAANNTIQQNADGSVVYQGLIHTYKGRTEIIQSSLLEERNKTDSLTRVISSLELSLSKEKENKTVDVKRGVNWILLSIIALVWFIIGYFFHKKIVSK